MKTKLLTGLLFSALLFNAKAQNLGKALWFDGTDDHVVVGNNANILEPDSLTIEAWFKKDRINSPGGKDRIMISVGSNGWGVGINPTNKIFFTKTGVSETNTSAVIADTSWHHIAVTHNGATVFFYIDGQLDSQVNYNVSFNSSNNYTIGSRGSGSEFFQGRIDEIRIWNIVRTQQEIENNKCVELSGSETGLLSYYKFNENSGSVLNDFSSSGNNGALTNIDTVSSWVASTDSCGGGAGIESELQVQSLTVYPNPSNGKLLVSGNLPLVSGVITIYNVTGEKVYQQPVTSNQQQLSTNFPSGIYFLQVINENNIIATSKIVIQ